MLGLHLLLWLTSLFFPIPQGPIFGGTGGGGGSTVAFVNDGKNDSASSASLAVTISVSASNTACVFSAADGTTISSISGGGTYTQLETESSGYSNDEVWCTGPGASTSASTVTVTYGSAQQVNAIVAQYSGVTHLGHVSNNFSSSGGTLPACTLTIQDANNWMITGTFSANASGPAISPTVGTLRDQFNNASNILAVLLDNTVASAGSLTNSTTLTASSNWGTVCVELRTH